MLKQVSSMTGATIIKHLDDIARTPSDASGRVVLNPDDVVGSCGLFTVRYFRTVLRGEKQARYVDVRAARGAEA